MDERLEIEFTELRESNKEIKKILTELYLKINNIDLCLNGQYGLKGLVRTVAEHTSYINSDRKFKGQLFGGFTVIAIIWGVMVKFWDKIFK